MGPYPVIEFQRAAIFHSRNSFTEPDRNGKSSNRDLVLSDINLRIMPGEIVYLIGRVGSGKSSFLKTIYGEKPLLEGRAHVVGYDLTRLRNKEVPFLRRRMGIVFQDYQLLTDRSVYENLHFVLKATGWRNEAQIKNQIRAVLNQVSLVNKEYKMPFQLSGGEQQRLAIARALLNSPRLILADEPTGNLDPAAADQIMQLFRSIAAEGCAILMATHNIGNLQQYPSRTLRFGQGRIEEIDLNDFFGN